MTWAFSVALPSDPSGCAAAARSLRAAAEAARAAADVLADHAALPRSVLGGLTARAYCSAARDLVADTRGSAADTAALADALEAYAAAVTDVRATLTRVRADAVHAGLRVTPDGEVQWPPAPVPELEQAYRRLAGTAEVATAAATAAREAWWAAVQEHTKGGLPSRARGEDRA